jgi:hypothetical protein
VLPQWIRSSPGNRSRWAAHRRRQVPRQRPAPWCCPQIDRTEAEWADPPPLAAPPLLLDLPTPPPHQRVHLLDQTTHLLHNQLPARFIPLCRLSHRREHQGRNRGKCRESTVSDTNCHVPVAADGESGREELMTHRYATPWRKTSEGNEPCFQFLICFRYLSYCCGPVFRLLRVGPWDTEAHRVVSRCRVLQRRTNGCH